MIRPVFALSVLLAFAAPTLAEGCEMTTSQPEITTPVCGVDDIVPCFYVDIDFCQPCMTSFWVYQESNGIPGLQRGDEVSDDTCGGIYPSDTIIF